MGSVVVIVVIVIVEIVLHCGDDWDTLVDIDTDESESVPPLISLGVKFEIVLFCKLSILLFDFFINVIILINSISN